MAKRIAPQNGEWIDRSESISFFFEGKSYTGFAGDTITSALLASGVRTLGRSFKYHRPRGTLSFANHDANAMVQDGYLPNVRADVTPVKDGQKLKAVNTVGGVKWDLGQVNNHLSDFLPVGFYYKAFHKPAAFFPYWERFIRNAGGLGSVGRQDPRSHWPKGYGFADVLVAGGGPSGLSAAISAAESGARVVLAEENPGAGGTLTYAKSADEGGGRVLDELLEKVRSNPNIDLRTDTIADAHFTDHWVPLVNRDSGMTKMRVKSVVVAGGALEQPAVFRNNDLPGVMLGSGAQRMIYHYSVRPFERAVVLASNSDAYGVVLDLLGAGVDVEAVVDLRREGEPSSLGDAVRDAGVKIHTGSCIYEAQAEKGGMGVGGAVITPLDSQNNPIPSRGFQIDCDGICVSVGWMPNFSLLGQAGCRAGYSEDLHQFVPAQLTEGMFSTGRTNGLHRREDKLLDGHRAGLEAARHAGYSVSEAIPEVPAHTGEAPSHPYPVYDHPKGMAFVDFDEDVQLKDLKHSVQEGFDSIPLVNRFATLGMGPSQGKHSHMNGIRIMAKLMNQSIEEAGTITSRPFFHPVEMGVLAGRSFHPHRYTPIHHRHEDHNAVFMRAGDWFRPEYYANRGKDRESAVLDEVRAVHNQVAMIDVTPLGKIEISGPDAAEFADRVCTGRLSTIKEGMTRYAVMTDEAGIVTDDGVCARLSENSFYLTATTSGVAAFYQEITRWQEIWGLDVQITNHTNNYGAMNLAGPHSREVMAKVTDMDLSEDAFPYLAWREGEVAGVEAKVLRVGFVGELGYEVHVPMENSLHVWDSLMEAGGEYGIQPFGLEAQRRLRLEKGHLLIGQDTDGLTNPWEVNLGWAVKLDKPTFIGKRTLEIVRRKADEEQSLRDEQSLQLVGKGSKDRQLKGFALTDPTQGPHPKECHLVIEDGEIVGRVTSCAYSEAVGKVIGLVFLPPERSVGSHFKIKVEGGVEIEAEVVSLPFYDPDGLRQKPPQEVGAQQGGR